MVSTENNKLLARIVSERAVDKAAVPTEVSHNTSTNRPLTELLPRPSIVPANESTGATASNKVAETAHWYCPDNTNEQQTITPSANKSNAMEGLKVRNGMGIKKIVHSILSHIGH